MGGVESSYLTSNLSHLSQGMSVNGTKSHKHSLQYSILITVPSEWLNSIMATDGTRSYRYFKDGLLR